MDRVGYASRCCARAASGQAAAAPSDEINSRRLMCFSPYKDSVPFVSFRRGREVLIAEIRLRRPSDNDEAAICRLMARIARCGQAIEGCRELRSEERRVGKECRQ